jgi:UDP-N-acetylglucosamine 2-epimerase (non-hydrolysing)
MKDLRILSIFGTRPEAIKMAPVVHLLAQTPGIASRVCITAQHRQMLDQVLNIFNLQPDIDLDLMQTDQALANLTSNIFQSLDPILIEEKPDWVLMQGDTTTVMVAAMCAFYHHINIGHVEAGLRTHEKYAPFPEEINRRIASTLADLHFAPTEHNRQNLLREGVVDIRIKVTGNTVIDALQKIVQLPMPAEVQVMLEERKVLNKERELITVTAHRRESFGQPIEEICHALCMIAETYPQQVELIYPVHLNPNIQEPVKRLLGGIPNITLLDPIEYLPMVHLLRHSKLVLTDSGGIQEEATGLGIPTLVLRDVTERPEGVEAGVLKLVGTNTQKIFDETCRLLEDDKAYHSMTHAANPFGDGHAAERIVQAILGYQG